jgi:serine/threonine protein kinase
VSVDTLENYQLEGLLGEGGIGQVYAAQDKVLGRRVAIKALRPELSRDRSFVDRFYNEAKSLANLNHTNITTLFALHVEGNEAFMVMELVDGQTLEALLARVGRLTLRDSLAILAQAVPGIRYAHRRGIIHRDLKPANLMLTDDGIVKIMDFGIARVRGSEHLTRVGEFCGTFVYASPEQIRGEDVDERSDLYSLAIMLYRMLAGTPPFASTNEYALMTAQLQSPPPPLTGQVPDLDAATEAALMRALAKRPEDRFESVEEFGRAIGAMAMRGESIDILQQLYAHAFAPEDTETTRVVRSPRPPPADPTMPSQPPLRSTAEWQLPPSLPGSETSVLQPEARSSGRRRVLAETQLDVPDTTDKGSPRPSRRWPVAAALIASLLLGGGYFAVSNGVLPGLASSSESRPVAAAGEPRTAAPLAPASPEFGNRQTPPSTPPRQAGEEEPPPVRPLSTKSEPSAAPSSAPSSAPGNAPNVQPSPSPARIEATNGEPSTPPAPVETARLQPAPPPAPSVETATVRPAPPPPVPRPVEAVKSEPPRATVAAESSPATAPPPEPEVPIPAPAPPASPLLKQAGAPPPANPPANLHREEPPLGTPANPASAATVETRSAPSPPPAEPMVVAKAEPTPSPEPRPPLGPKATADPLKPEGEPDLQGRVTGAKRLDEIEIAARWIKIYGIVDRARGTQEAQHVKVLVRYLKPSRNRLMCYRKAADTYRCYSDGQDIARLALQDGMVDLAPNAPAEYRSLLSARR